MQNIFVSIILLTALIAMNNAVCNDHLTHEEVSYDKPEITGTSTTMSTELHSCANIYDNAKSKLELIKQKLQAVSSLEEYEQNIKERFNTLNTLDAYISQCNTDDEPELAYKFKKLALSVKVLKNNSQASAFTSFKDWVESKEKDLSAFHEAY